MRSAIHAASSVNARFEASAKQTTQIPFRYAKTSGCRSCVVKPPELCWFLNSSKAFSASARPDRADQGKNLVIEIGDQHRVLVAGHSFVGLPVGFDKAEQPLTVIPLHNHRFALEGAAQHHDATRLAV
jgi:hypothetical protein